MQQQSECLQTIPLPMATLMAMLRDRVTGMANKQVFRFLRDDGSVAACLTYRELHERAMAIGGELQRFAAPGERALLLFPPGLDFIEAFFGCLYSGIVAVPAALPTRHRSTLGLEAIFSVTTPSLILTTSDHQDQAFRSYARQSRLTESTWVAVDQVRETRQHTWNDPGIDANQIAFLQFTSGSTSLPKGVMLSHENLLHNAGLISGAFETTTESTAVFWLPLHHDMGLIGGVIQPVYCGGSCTFLAPAAFLQRPALWLETISSARATVSGGPDFAYDLCARKVSPKERDKLDLSSWRVAFTGAERIREQTLDRFFHAFSPCRFRREAFFPCYGLAEATLMVSGGPRRSAPTVVYVDSAALALNQVQETTPDESMSRSVVGCGKGLPSQRSLIVDPETHLPCPDGRVGEIWVQGPSVAMGYYERPEATAATFGAHLADTGDGPFLRTGDLGFIRKRQLYVTGRLKDLIIIRGRNHYPEDIEHSVDRSYKGLRTGYCAAFSVDVDDRDRLVIVQEVEPRRRDLDTGEAFQAIRHAVATRHDLEVYTIVLAKAGAIPKTSSGKTRRSACRDHYLSGHLSALAVWKRHLEDAKIAAAAPPTAPRPHRTAAEIEAWLVQKLATRLRLQESDVHVSAPFFGFGMGSLDAVEVAADLECWMGRRVSPIAIYNYPNISALAQWLAKSPPDVELADTPQEMLPPAIGPEQLLREVRDMSERDMEVFISQQMAKQEGS